MEPQTTSPAANKAMVRAFINVESHRHNGVTQTSVTFRGKEVEKQPFRFIVMVLAVPVGVIGLLLAGVSLALTPVWLFMHVLLRALGRQGFYKREEKGGSLNVAIGPSLEGFKRR